MRSQQIALDTLGNEAQSVAIAALLLTAQASRNPGRQFAQTRRDQLDGDTSDGQRLQPDRLFIAPVQPRKRHQQKHLGGRMRAVVLMGCATLAPRLAARNAQIDQRAATK